MGKITTEQIDKWIEAVKVHVGLDDELLNDQEAAEKDPVTYEKCKDEHDDLLKLQEFLEKFKSDYRFQPPNYIARLLHRTVTIYLYEGDVIEGIIDGFNNYEIRIKTKDRDLLIPKHAIKLIEGDFSRQDKAKKDEGVK